MTLSKKQRKALNRAEGNVHSVQVKEVRKEVPFSTLKGLVINYVNQTKTNDYHGNDMIVFKTKCRRTFEMFHDQSCCEHVLLEELQGDWWKDIVNGNPITKAYRKITKEGDIDGSDKRISESSEHFTASFYELATCKGSVTMRWYGESTGAYSEEVELYEVIQQPIVN